MSKNAALVEGFAENFLGLFESAIDKVASSYTASVAEALTAKTQLDSKEAELAEKQTNYDTAFADAIQYKEQSAEAQSDQAAADGEMMVGAAAARAQANVGLEFSVTDAQESADAAAALTFGASNGASGTTEVSDSGAVSYTANEDAVAALGDGESFSDTISYATRVSGVGLFIEKDPDGNTLIVGRNSENEQADAYSIETIDVTVTKTITADGIALSVTDLSALEARGAKQASAEATVNGLSASEARNKHTEVDYLLGTEANPGLPGLMLRMLLGHQKALPAQQS